MKTFSNKRTLQFTLTLISIILSSCMEKPEMDENINPVSLTEVQKAMVESWGQSDPASMNKNDFIYLETEQRIELQPPKVVLQEGITVSKKEETNNEFNYTFLYQTSVISGEQNQQSTREDHRCVSKNENGCKVTAADTTLLKSTAASTPLALKAFTTMQESAVKTKANDLQMSLGFEKFISLAYACQKNPSVTQYCREKLGADSCDIICSNLKTTEEIQPLPPLIKAQPNCGGFPNCSLNIKKVTFDWSFIVKKGTSTQTQKINYSIVLSQDMPFYSRVMEFCSRGLIDVPQIGSKVLVGICSKLKNYQPGQPLN